MTQEPTGARKTPAVLFVCSKNGGESQLAAGLMNQLAVGTITVHSAGTKPGKSLNPQTVESLAELGIDITATRPPCLSELRLHWTVRAAGLPGRPRRWRRRE